MRPLLISLTLLAATSAVFAQTGKTPEQIREEMRLQYKLYGCPLGIVAQQQGSPAAIWTTSLEDSHKSAAELKTLHSGVHVNLDSQHKQIKSAELAVYFLPPGTRALPIAGSQFTSSLAPAQETRKNFSLASGKIASRQLDGDLLLGPVASITNVSLMRVTYEDGSEWIAPTSRSCSVKPSLYMPVQTK